MKAIKFAALLVTSTIALGAVSQTAVAQAKTREQVRQELVQAQHAGLVPTSKTHYPPSDALVARNKETHAATRHAGEATPEIDHHDSVAAR
ncbi:DUF4148 domain-containing protein [Caballeronia sp. Lep1P3]|uniref:DUF4148 domain-containing protein n=1 Tax=Caballeronia sp. Lep1P3 TaxID=2878150 RepID=UPI00025B9DAB|nr:DUF4148 domain-containing protein [Caballeronia sp. Lep1P3]EKS72768.1 hypothetical protein BURK_004927 [Burkholderia sp. SJ98]